MNRLLHLDEVNSTNTYLKTRQDELPHGTVVYADRQSAGRGRYDRQWVSQAGGLYFSVLLKPSQNSFLPNLTQLMALSICYALEACGLHPAIKWPNDVQISGRKISGILSEAVFGGNRLQAVIVGVGLNVAQEGLDNVGQPATSLKQEGVLITREEILDRILHFFWQDYPKWQASGFAAFRAPFIRRFAALGKTVSVKDGTETIFGTAEGISPQGTLLLRTAAGLKEIYIGDVSV